MFTNSGSNRFWGDASGSSENGSGLGLDRARDYLTSNGVPDADARAYAEGVRRGHTLVAAKCDDSEVDWVVDILDDDDVLDLDKQQETWRSEGWSDFGTSDIGSGTTTSAPSAGMMSGAGMSGQDSMRDDERLM